MKTQRERAEEKRAERLEEIERLKREGGLVVRQMTDEEKEKFPPPDPDRPRHPRRRG